MRTRPPPTGPQGDAPFGTTPRRSPAPLLALVLAFLAWFACLLWLAFTYPAR